MKPKAFNYTAYTDLEADMMIARAEIEQLRKELEWKDMVIELAERTAQAPRWIPVTERLPEAFTPVIVCREGAKGERIVEQGHKDVGEWWKVYGTRTKHVTYWMPLPEAPEEAE